MDYCAAVNLSGKEQSLTVPHVLLWSTSFVHTEMLPVECSVVDWGRVASLGPLNSLASLYKHAKARHRSPVRVRQILSKKERSSTSLSTFMLNWVQNYPSVIELYQTADHPALSHKVCHLQWRDFPAYFLGGFCSTTWKTRHQNPPIDWDVWEGGRYACGLAWLFFTTDIVFWRFLQTYMTSGHCSCWFLLVIEQRIFWHYLGF